MENFKRLQTGFDVERLSSQLSAQPDLWSEITERQKYPGSAHKDSESIFLRWCAGKTVDAAFSEIPAYNYPAFAKLPAAQELVQMVMLHANAKELGRALVVNLKAGGKVDQHIDEGSYADHYERFHVVIDSKPGNLFFCGNEAVEMKTGDIWWFNHKLEHWVQNDSDSPRIHLIVDVVAPSFRRERHALSA